MSYRSVYNNDVSYKYAKAQEYGRSPIPCPVCGHFSSTILLEVVRNGVLISSWIGGDDSDYSHKETVEGFVCSDAKEEWHIVRKHEMRKSGELRDNQHSSGYRYHEGFREY